MLIVSFRITHTQSLEKGLGMTLLSELNVKVHIDIAIVLNETPKHPLHDAVVYTSTSCS